MRRGTVSVQPHDAQNTYNFFIRKSLADLLQVCPKEENLSPGIANLPIARVRFEPLGFVSVGAAFALEGERAM
jgi:hypothetical protein